MSCLQLFLFKDFRKTTTSIKQYKGISVFLFSRNTTEKLEGSFYYLLLDANILNLPLSTKKKNPITIHFVNHFQSLLHAYFSEHLSILHNLIFRLFIIFNSSFKFYMDKTSFCLFKIAQCLYHADFYL